ncbi:UDP-glucuronosyl and UDP-glucosyl transferase [Handroanthus impetiginosus]|uniref:UDP-glucuronosyl and UDP-glucosyl transferase n=1 Tax=Handroanthus impetiginosus TaxID=429701 RepID=A0A2G9GFA9_9LAMI|nr:UDP-glucuronosyl and UDP-glucosyl transferase [Handroanthus impetiginosus]
MREKNNLSFKILMLPWLAHGRIFPFLKLAKSLSRRNFIVYLCSTSINLDSIKNSKKKDSSYDDISIKLVELHIPSLAFQMSSSSFLDILSSVTPNLLIYDMFQLWAPKIASLKGIPSVCFATSGAAPFSFYHHVYTIGNGSTFPYPAIYLLDHERVNFRDRLIPYIKDADDDFAFGDLTMSCEIVLMKSFKQVEEKYIDYLSVLCKKRVVPSGPLIADSDDYDHEEFSKIMKWLSGKSRQYSTVYVSFSSEYFLSKKQIVEIAKPLELSRVNFIWVFLERVKRRGFIGLGWAPQKKILAHSSVGGFVSHYGWSSIMEGMYFGVPIMAMSMKSEQPINAWLVVEASVRVGVQREGGGLYVTEKIAKGINQEKKEQETNEAAMELLKICMKNKLQE